MSMPQKMMRRLERAEALDGAAKPVSKAVQRAVRPRLVRNLLSGTNLGHPLHPTLTDVPIGAWSMAALLDIAGDAMPSRRPICWCGPAWSPRCPPPSPG